MALTDLTRISTSGIATGTSLSGAILHGDAHFRGTQVGVTSALFDSSDDALEFNDNVKLAFGNSGDLQVYHTGNNSIIRDQGTGTLSLQSNGTEIALYNTTNDKYMGKFANNAQVELYHAGNLKITTDQAGAKVTGVLTATSFSGSLIGSPINNPSGISTFYDLRVSNNLTVEGTTTTLDTNLIGVDRVEVGANSNSVVGVAITQSGTADIINLFDGATKVLAIDDTGSVGIGTEIPQTKLEVSSATGTRIRARHTNVSGVRDAGFDIWSDDSGTFAARASLVHSGSAGKTTLYAQNRFNIHSDQTDTSLYIARSGEVGIGTISPSGLTHWVAPSDMNLYLKSKNSSGTIRWNYEDEGGTVRANHAFVNYGNAKTDYFTWGTHDGSSLAERLRITKEGNVGINSTLPSERLDVGGNIKLGTVQGTNTNAALNVLYQHNDNVIHGGSGLTYNPGGDVLSVNGNHISANVFRGDGATGTLTCDNHSSTTFVTVSNTVDISTVDNATDAFTLKQGSNEYITVDTTNSSELITLGNTTTNPKTIILGGNVGINDTDPSYKLNVIGDNAAYNGIGMLKGIIGVQNDTTAFGSSPTAGISFQTKYRTGPDVPLDVAAIWGGKENTTNGDKDGYMGFATREEGGSGSQERMRIDSSGRLIIGYTASVAKHQTSANLQISGTSVDKASASLGIWGASADPARLEFSKSRNSTIGSHTAVAADDTLGEINFSGSDGTRYLGSAYIKATATTPIADYDVAGYLSFGTNYGTTSPSERVRITKDGYVHIGTASHLGTMRVGGQAITGQDQDPIIKVYTSSSNQWLAQLRSDHTTGNGIFLRAGNSSSTYTLYATGYDENNPHLIVRGDGKVGINQDTPRALLSLGGTLDAQKMLLYDNDGGTNEKYGFGIQSNELRQFAGGTAILSFGHVSSSDGSTYAERLRITSAGIVQFKDNGGTYTNTLQSHSGESGFITHYTARTTSGADLYRRMLDIASGGANPHGSAMRFLTSDDNTNPATCVERMRILNNGGVFIGAIGHNNRYMHAQAPGLLTVQNGARVDSGGMNQFAAPKGGFCDHARYELENKLVSMSNSNVNIVQARNGQALGINEARSSWSHYNNLPNYLLGHAATDNINNNDFNLTLYADMTVFLLRSNGWNPISNTSGFSGDWQLIESDTDIDPAGSATRLYVTTVSRGTYSWDNNSAMYFFVL